MIDKILWKLYKQGFGVGRKPEGNNLPTAIEMVGEAKAQLEAYILKVIGEDENVPDVENAQQQYQLNQAYEARNILRAEQRARLKEIL